MASLTVGTAQARPGTPAKTRTMQIPMTDQWRSPVAPDAAGDAARKRWLPSEDLTEYSEDNSGFRWRLHGAKVKMRMPFALH